MKNRIVYIVFSIAINVIVLSIVRGFLGMDTACVLAIFLYFTFTYFIFKWFEKHGFLQNLIIILLGTLIVHLPQRIINFRSQLVSLPELVCELLGLILGYLFFYLGKTGKIAVLCVTILLSIIIYCRYDKVLDLLNYSNIFYKNTKQINIDSVPYFDSNNIKVNSILFNSDKYIILNVWATTCGPCIAEFPQIDSFYTLTLNTNNIKLYTACILQKEDKKTPFEIAKTKEVNFPIFTIPNWDFVRKEYNMDGVPVTFVLKDNAILFRGNLLDAWNAVNVQIKNAP